MFNRIINTLIRGCALFSKFLLIIFIAKFLSPSDVGLYGLIAGSIYYFLFALGFEFYTYSNRELVGIGREKWLAMLRDQLIFYIFTYTLVFPISSYLFFYDWIPLHFAAWFYLLLLLEHCSQELNRVLVLMSNHFTASWILLLRNSGCILSLIIMFLFPSYRTLDTVCLCWALGAFLSCLLGLRVIFALDKNSLKSPIDRKWIIKGIKIAFPLLLASLSIRCIFFLDRYFVDVIAGRELLGVYVLYMGIGNAVLNFLDSGVISFLYPNVIAAAKSKNSSDYSKAMNQLFYNVFFSTIFLIGGAIVVSRFLIFWLAQDVYVTNYDILLYILAAIFFYALSCIPQIGLYALNNDRPNVLANILSLISFLGIVVLLNSNYGIRAIPYSLCISFLFMLLTKVMFYFFTLTNCLHLKKSIIEIDNN